MTTHELEQGKNMISIQYRVGHKLLSTTSRSLKKKKPPDSSSGGFF